MDVPARQRLSTAHSAPPATVAGLLGTVAVVAGALVLHSTVDRGDPAWARAFLLLLTGLFALRVAGQVVVVVARPAWLPPMTQWNLLPYPLLLPIQILLLGGMTALALQLSDPGDDVVGRVLIGLALAYWAAMALRYAVRMRRRPEERWFGGAIPIVFHCVLAAWLFVLGSFHAIG
jgi:hypothetical protein